MQEQPPLLQRELLVVTGKGGVGKTTVAAALALACANAGLRVVVCEVSGQSRVPRLLGYEAPVSAGREVELTPRLWATTIDPERALAEWAAREVLPRPLVEALVRSSAFSAFVGAAPGAAELVSATKAWELGRSGGDRGSRWTRRAGYDVVILDAPASGHGLALLRAPRTFADIARIGPIAKQARRAADLIEDPSRTAVIAVTSAEETPVNETLELEARCAAAIGHGPELIVANAIHRGGLRGAEREALTVAASHSGLSGAVLAATRTGDGRARLQAAQLRRLRRHSTAPVTTLPLFGYGALAADEIGDLARALDGPLAA